MRCLVEEEMRRSFVGLAYTGTGTVSDWMRGKATSDDLVPSASSDENETLPSVDIMSRRWQ